MPSILPKRFLRPLLILAAAVWFWLPLYGGAAAATADPSPVPAEGTRVLLLYDSLAIGTRREDETAAAARFLQTLGAKVTVESMSAYRSGALANYERLVVLTIDPALESAAPPELQRELESFPGSVLQLGGVALPAAAGDQPLRRYGPAPQGGAEGRLATARLLREWMGLPGHGQLYALIRGFTPYSDYSLLRSLADELYEGGIPFLVAARPVLDNLQFPAAKRYAETLRYIQGKQGSVLLEAPAVFPVISAGIDPLKLQTGAFLDMLMTEGVAPLGIAAEQYWTFDRHYSREGMGFFDSAVVYADKTESPVYREKSSVSAYFPSTLYSISPDFPREWEMLRVSTSSYPVDTAVTLDFPESKKDLEALVKTLKAYPAVFADYRDREHTTRTAAHTASALSGKVRIDGVLLASEARETGDGPDDDFTYIEREKASFTGFFQAQNQIFLAVVVGALAVFTLFIAAGRRLYRRKFLK